MTILKRTFAILLLLAVCSVVSCLLFPLVWQGYDWNYPPARVFRRIWMIAILAGLLVCRNRIGLQNPADAGFTLSLDALRNVVIGLLAVFLFLAALSFVYVWLEAWTVRDPLQISAFVHRAKNGLIRGTLVATIEEYVFRGLILLPFVRRWGWPLGAVVSSLIFASLHFFEGRGLETLSNPDSWLAGFQLCGLLLSNMTHEFTLFPDAVGLFVVGLALCQGVRCTGTLWYGVGLHGGWIFYFSVRKAFFLETGQWSEFYIGGTRLFDGLIPIVGMLAIFPVTSYLSKKRILRS